MDHRANPEAPEPDLERDPRIRAARRWLLRFARITLAFVGLLVLTIVGWLQSNDFEHRVIAQVETSVARSLGQAIHIDAVHARYWPPGITVTGLRIFNAETDTTIVSADQVRIPIRLRFTGGAEIGRIQLLRPVVHLHIEEDGSLREFRRRPGPSRPMSRLPISGIAIEDGTVQLDYPDGMVAIKRLQSEPRWSGHAISGDLEIRAAALHQRAHFEWPGVQIGPEVVSIPWFALDLPSASLWGHASIDLDGPLDVALDATLRLEELSGLLQAPRELRGLVKAQVTATGMPADPVAHITINGQELGADLPGALTPLLTYDLGTVSVQATVTRHGAVIEQLTSDLGGGEIVASADIGPDLVLTNGTARGTGVHLEPILRAFDAAPTPWIDFDAEASLTFAGPLSPPHLKGDFTFHAADLQVTDRPFRDPRAQFLLDIPSGEASGTIELDVAAKELRLRATRVQTPRNLGSARVDIGLLPRGPLDLQFELPNADLQDFGPLSNTRLRGQGLVEGRIWGPFNALQLEGSGELEDFEVLGIHYADTLRAKVSSPDLRSLQLTDATATLRRTRYQGDFGLQFSPPLSMTTDLAITQGRIEDITGMFVDLDGLTGDLTGTLRLHGPLYEMDGSANLALAKVDLFGEPFPTGWGRGSMNQGRFTLDDLGLRRKDGTESITVRGSVDRGWALDMQLAANGLRLENLHHLKPHHLPLTGQLSMSARIQNTLFEPSPAGRVELTQVRYLNEPVPDSTLRFTTVDGIANLNGRLLGNTARLTGTLGLFEQQPYSLSAQLTALPAHTLYPIAADGKPLAAEVSGVVNVEGHFGEHPSPVSVDASLPTVEVRYHDHTLRNQGTWTYNQTGPSFMLHNINLHGDATHFALDMESDKDLRLAGEVELDLLRAVVPGLEKASGIAKVDLHATGPRPLDHATVNIGVQADLLRHSGAPLTFEDASVNIEARQDGITISNLRAKLGGGDVQGGGTIDAQAWKPTRYNLTMGINDAQVQWVKSLPPAIGNGRLAFDGPVDSLLLSGSIDVTEMTFADRIDWEDWVVSYQRTLLVDPAKTYDEDPLFSAQRETCRRSDHPTAEQRRRSNGHRRPPHHW